MLTSKREIELRNHENRAGLRNAIGTLRKCNDAHSDVIYRLEEYQRSVDGLTSVTDREKTGYGNGYEAELNYLRLRQRALDALIASVERYGQLPETRIHVLAASA
jgi:hypothetical protein